MISIQKIQNDNVNNAVIRALNDINAKQLFIKSGMIVLLKPNLLQAKPPERAVTTHPEIVRSVIKWVKQFQPKKIYVADSCGGIAMGQIDKVLQISGIQKVCEEEGAIAIGFEKTLRMSYKIEKPLVLDEIISSVLLKEADLIINLPKIKTHDQCTMTCSIKNMFGTILLGNKTQMHARFPTIDLFTSALVDIYSVSKPQLTIIDGYLCQEGKGPSAGDVLKLDLVIAGYDPVALDTLVCYIMNIDPNQILYLKKAFQKGLGLNDLAKIEIKGESLVNVKHPFKLPKMSVVRSIPIPQFIAKYLAKRLFTATIHFDEKKCQLCGTCWKNCPKNTILAPLTKEKKIPLWIKKDCISCYCCAELCPYDAVDLKIHIVRNLISSLYWILIPLAIIITVLFYYFS